MEYCLLLPLFTIALLATSTISCISSHATEVGRYRGKMHCAACKNCRYCKHCAKRVAVAVVAVAPQVDKCYVG